MHNEMSISPYYCCIIDFCLVIWSEPLADCQVGTAAGKDTTYGCFNVGASQQGLNHLTINSNKGWFAIETADKMLLLVL